MVTALTMGKVWYTQHLTELTRAFESSGELARLEVRCVIAGDGVAGDEVRAAVTTERVRVTGVLDRRELHRELDREPSPWSANGTAGLTSTCPRS